MKRYLLCSGLLLLILTATAKSRNTNIAPLSGGSLSFRQNAGQICDQHDQPRPDVLFSGHDGKLVFHLKNKGVSYQLQRIDSWKNNALTITPGEYEQIPDKITTYRIDIDWVNADAKASIQTGEALPGYDNFYLQYCPQGITGVKSYKSVTYQNIYPDINLVWYEQGGHLKYDYQVAAQADHRQIKFDIRGAENLAVNAHGDLVIETPLGTILEEAPVVMQGNKLLPASWVIQNNMAYYEIQNIDHNQAYVIDPGVRQWGTYYGGSAEDQVRICSMTPAGESYISGTTSSSANIATAGSHQFTSGGGTYDAFVAKFNTLGVRQWGTYYGGAGNDYGWHCLAVGNDVYVTGNTVTSAGSSIATAGSHQPASGGNIDAFLVKFSSLGVRQWGTYYGGGNNDVGLDIAYDAAGYVYLAGYSNSVAAGTAIATPGTHQPVANGFNFEAFLAKFNTGGVRQWGTYYGGTGLEYAWGVCVDLNSNVYLTGQTATNTGSTIATAGSHQPALGGINDAFLVKFNSSGIRQWGTYYGGNFGDIGYECAADANGNIYLAGESNSNNGPTIIATAGSHQPLPGGGTDAFLVKFNTNGVRQWGTYYGDIGADVMRHCYVDVTGNIYVTGSTNQSTGTSIATPGSWQSVGDATDAYMAVFNPAGVRQYGTYYGGGGTDAGWGVGLDAAGNIYLAGITTTLSGTAIASPGSHQSLPGAGPSDGFLVKFDAVIPLPIELMSFTGSCIEKNNVLLEWETASEMNNDFFTVERSADALSFESLGVVKGAGNSSLTTSYHFIDPSEIPGIFYYRLKQTDIDGSAKYSGVITVNKKCDSDQEQLTLYPNPNRGIFTILARSTLNLTVTNVSGQFIRSISLSDANNFSATIKGFSPGVYFIRAKSAAVEINKKVIIID